MTRFGRWFGGALLLVVALFVAGLMMPRTRNGAVAHIASTPSAGPAAGGREQALIAPSGLTIPVAGVRGADLTDMFGDPRGAAGERGHGALDIMAPRGTPVLAAADGRVEKMFDSELGGHTIYIRSPNGRNIYYYAHLDSYAAAAREGAIVHAGERIGTVGSSGDANPAAPHLHFEIKRMAPGQPWHQGVGINPYPLLAGKVDGG